MQTIKLEEVESKILTINSLHNIKKSINFTDVSKIESGKHAKIFDLTRRLLM